MPRIKSLLNGEVNNVRGDIARELIRMGVAEALDTIEEVTRKGQISVSTDGTVAPDGEAAYRLPRYGDHKPAVPRFYVDLYEGKYVSIFLEIGGVIRHYRGDPDCIHNRRDHTGREFCSALGFPVPVEIQKEYLRQWKKNSSLRDPGAPGIHQANQTSRQDGPTWIADRLPSNETMAAEVSTRYEQQIGTEQVIAGNTELRGDKTVIAEAKRKINTLEKLAGVEPTNWKKEGF